MTGEAERSPMPTINVLTFNVFEKGLACRGSLHGSLKPHQSLTSYLNSYPLTFFPASRKICIDYLCQTYRPNGQFSVGLSSNGRIMVKPTDCSLSKSNTSSLLENQTSIFREGHLIVKIHKKKNDLFAHVRRKAYLCSWTITS